LRIVKGFLSAGTWFLVPRTGSSHLFVRLTAFSSLPYNTRCGTHRHISLRTGISY